MKKFLVILILFFLIFSFSLAKEVTVVFEYPTEDDFIRSLNVSEDANTYSILVQISDENNIPIDLNYHEQFGYFINAINNFYPDEENGEFWSFFINGESSFVGISQYVPSENDELLFRIISFGPPPEDPIEEDPVENAVNWLVTNQKESGEIGSHEVWGNAFSLMALSLFNDFNLIKQNAINYLLDNQKEDAGFGYSSSTKGDTLLTAVSILALTSNNYTLSQFDKNNIISIDFLKSKQEDDGGFEGWGVSDNDTTAWSVMAFASVSEQLPKKNNLDAVDFMVGTQNIDGGFGYNASQNSTFDYTAEVLIALNAAGYSKNIVVNDAINYLLSNIDENGCIGSIYDTALTSIAFNSYGEDFANLNSCVVSKQLSDGGFSRHSNGESNSVDTAISIIALKEKTFPVKILISDSNYLLDSNALIAVGDTVEFILKIKNTGEVNAKNISISLSGINPDFIKEEISDLFISEIKVGEEKTARIFVEMKEVGDFNVTANISGVGIAGMQSSNVTECIVKEAQLEMNFGVAS